MESKKGRTKEEKNAIANGVIAMSEMRLCGRRDSPIVQHIEMPICERCEEAIVKCDSLVFDLVQQYDLHTVIMAICKVADGRGNHQGEIILAYPERAILGALLPGS